jgi:hypothetical protein
VRSAYWTAAAAGLSTIGVAAVLCCYWANTLRTQHDGRRGRGGASPRVRKTERCSVSRGVGYPSLTTNT